MTTLKDADSTATIGAIMDVMVSMFLICPLLYQLYLGSKIYVLFSITVLIGYSIRTDSPQWKLTHSSPTEELSKNGFLDLKVVLRTCDKDVLTSFSHSFPWSEEITAHGYT